MVYCFIMCRIKIKFSYKVEIKPPIRGVLRTMEEPLQIQELRMLLHSNRTLPNV